jgi:hypothetical protein
VRLAAFFPQPHPEAAVLRVDVLHLHSEGRADAGESALSGPVKSLRQIMFNTVQHLECAPAGGQFELVYLPPFAGLLENRSHGQASFP